MFSSSNPVLYGRFYTVEFTVLQVDVPGRSRGNPLRQTVHRTLHRMVPVHLNSPVRTHIDTGLLKQRDNVAG